MGFGDKKRVLVTGGAGFLGCFVVEKLRERGCKQIFVPRSKDYDLVEMEAVKRLYRDTHPDIVIHLVARVGGIPLRFASGTDVGANREHPAEFFYDNPSTSSGQA